MALLINILAIPATLGTAFFFAVNGATMLAFVMAFACFCFLCLAALEMADLI